MITEEIIDKKVKKLLEEMKKREKKSKKEKACNQSVTTMQKKGADKK